MSNNIKFIIKNHEKYSKGMIEKYNIYFPFYFLLWLLWFKYKTK